MLDAGIYYGQLSSWVTTEAKTGNPQIALEFSIGHFQHGSDWREVPPARRTLYLSLTDKAWEYTQAKLETLGFNGDFGLGMAFDEKAQTEGVELKCEHEDYEGKTRERWDLLNWGGNGAEPANDQTINHLNAKWKAKVGSKPSPPGKPPSAPQQQHTAIAEDDIPFDGNSR